MLVSEGHAAAEAILILVAWSQLLLRAISGSMVLQQLGLVLMSMVHVTTEGGRGAWEPCTLKSKGHAEPAPTLLALGDLALSFPN